MLCSFESQEARSTERRKLEEYIIKVEVYFHGLINLSIILSCFITCEFYGSNMMSISCE